VPSTRRPRSSPGCSASGSRRSTSCTRHGKSCGSTICARGVIPQRRRFALFVLGGYGAQTDAQPQDLLPFLAAHDPECPWAACAFGPYEGACLLTPAGLGGHVRVGFENNLRLADGRLAMSNAELVAQVTAAAPLLGRKLADIATTRAFLARRRVDGPAPTPHLWLSSSGLTRPGVGEGLGPVVGRKGVGVPCPQPVRRRPNLTRGPTKLGARTKSEHNNFGFGRAIRSGCSARARLQRPPPRIGGSPVIRPRPRAESPAAARSGCADGAGPRSGSHGRRSSARPPECAGPRE
jgi:beta-keto acid cleavage enzyme